MVCEEKGRDYFLKISSSSKKSGFLHVMVLKIILPEFVSARSSSSHHVFTRQLALSIVCSVPKTANMTDRRRVNGPASGTSHIIFDPDLIKSYASNKQRPIRTREARELRKICMLKTHTLDTDH